MMFSIIIPAYNAAGHIRKALESVKAQDFDDYELIVVCDSCTDDTEQIAKEYGARTATVNFNRDGLTRNVGINMAQGRYILFMDDDDHWLHEYVLTMLFNMIVLNDADIIAFAFIWKGRGYASPQHDGGLFYPAVWNKCYKRSIIGDTRFGDEWSVSDLPFTQALFAKKPKIFAWNMPFYYYNYMRKGSITERDSHEPCTKD